MKAVAPHDRPREKLHRLGAAALGDNELVAAVLGQGQAQAGALDLANAILSGLGGIERLARARGEDLTRIAGVGPARAAQVLAAVELGRRTLTRLGRERLQITSPRLAAELLLPQYGSRPVEHFGVVLLDTKHRVLRIVPVSSGTLDASVVHPREVFREAVAARASAIVLFHNHPSGDPEPSPEDVAITRHMAAAGRLLGIDVLDHVILADVRFCSLRERKCF
ncbi:MAG TPA: DNA repair protein RadC [Vicinamibacterales bacterium]|nr:DNA repair protein RadC [Vicinamibacterales bacterium]